MMALLKRNTNKKTEATKPAPKTQAKKNVQEDEIMAAIATAIAAYSQGSYEQIDSKMTIKRIDRPYSPWSSKIYMMRKWPR
ncbi:MAG TPA: hypothetical protein VN514_06360 [Ignavibacteria bacterium]|nr:hypothetical protein [Ignavibacteria bacterium]